jgi:hypothetical protein
MRAETVDNMLRQHATGHPKLGGFAYGWNENIEPEFPRFLDHGGKMAGFSSEALIIPERGAGFFFVHHGENANITDPLKWEILLRFFRDSASRLPRPRTGTINEPLARFAGRYAWNTWCRTCPGQSPSMFMNVAVNGDTSITLNGRSWVQVEPLVFVRDDGRSRVAFRADSVGKITHVFLGGFWVFERYPP